MSDYLRPHVLYTPWNSPGQNTGVGSLSLLQGIFPTQGSNPGLPHYRWILYQLSHKGSPRILEWVAYPFCSRSSQPRNRTWISWIVGGFLNNWAIRKAHISQSSFKYSDSSVFFFFLMWTIFKSLYWILLLSFVLVFWPRVMWDLSSPTRNGAWTSRIGRQSLNHWTTGKSIPSVSHCIKYTASEPTPTIG